jgi:hypothetical protein
MNCYKALKINSFSGSVGISSTGSDYSAYGNKVFGNSRKVDGTCKIITPFTNFTNRELKCRALLDYRVANDPEIVANGWLIRRYYLTHDVGGLCSNCGLEGDLKYENDGAVWGEITSTGSDPYPALFSAGEWGAFKGPWFNPFQFCKRAQEILFNGRADRYIFLSGGGVGVGLTALVFKCYNIFNGSASDSKSYDYPATAFEGHKFGSASGTFTWKVTIE